MAAGSAEMAAPDRPNGGDLRHGWGGVCACVRACVRTCVCVCVCVSVEPVWGALAELSMGGGWASLVTITWSVKHASHLLSEQSPGKKMCLDKPSSQ